MLRFFAQSKRRRSQLGFTMIEIVVVLGVLGITLSLASPRYLGARKRAYKAEIEYVLQELKTMSWAYYQEYNRLPTNTTQISFLMPSGSAWNRPFDLSANYNLSVIWMANGNGTKGVKATDFCWITIRTNGSTDQGCTF